MFHWPVAINCSSVLPALERKCLLSGTLARPGSQGAVPPAQEHSLPQDSCIATTAIQEGPLCHLQHFHLPSPSGFQWSTLHQKSPGVTQSTTMGNVCQIRHRPDLVVLHTWTAESSVTESSAQGLLQLWAQDRAVPQPPSSSGRRGSCLVVPDMNPFCAAIIQGVFPWPCACEARVHLMFRASDLTSLSIGNLFGHLTFPSAVL